MSKSAETEAVDLPNNTVDVTVEKSLVGGEQGDRDENRIETDTVNPEDDDDGVEGEDEEQGSSLLGKIYVTFEVISAMLWVFSHFYGVFRGASYAYYTFEYYSASTLSFNNDLERYRSMSRFSVPGAPGIHDTGLPPFYIPVMKTFNWRKRLGLMKKTSRTIADDDNTAMEPASFEGLTYRPDPTVRDSDPGYKWVFVTDWGFVGEAWPWNVAFDELLQHSDAIPAANNASLHILECHDATHLCQEWFVRAPSLMLFITRATVVTEGLEEPQVPIYIHELPFDRPLPTGAFPSQFEQLRFLTSLDEPWEYLYHYNRDTQFDRRYEDWLRELGEWRYPIIPKVAKAQDLLEQHLFFLPQDLAKEIGVLMGQLITTIDLVAWIILKDWVYGSVKTWFVKGPNNQLQPPKEPETNFWDDFWGDAIGGFVDQLNANITKSMLDKTTATGSDTAHATPEMNMEWLANLEEQLMSVVRNPQIDVESSATFTSDEAQTTLPV